MTMIMKGAHIIDSDEDGPKSSLHFYPHISRKKCSCFIFFLCSS